MTPNTARMEHLMQQLDTAENSIQVNNENTIVNASKDRLRVKKRKDEIDRMLADYETNCKKDPAEVDKTVK